MAVLFPHYNMLAHPAKRSRRNATAVMAGDFDIRPPRDVLTSLLNGVGPYKAVERDEEARQKRKKEKKEREREKKKGKNTGAARPLQQEHMGEARPHASTDGNIASTSSLPQAPPPKNAKAIAFWRQRPTILIAAMQRSVSITPSPTESAQILDFTPGSTPGPSISSSTSRTSSKRPRTPDDDEFFGSQSRTLSAPLPTQPRRKRHAAKKGWKGWVEGSPEPSEKLINLDAVPVLQERRTRSGKNFDAIGVGKESWVSLTGS
ncbi:hypothetical protein B0H34DRAFT_714350 [Crassisporium funariophilum]|nr:hypothetical protein B0H34DRAFT_714350 [Crassisporium funariophilum]